jgi:hypothetical protein
MSRIDLLTLSAMLHSCLLRGSRAGNPRGQSRYSTREVQGMGVIEVDLFPEEVDSPFHPKAARFRKLLEEVADEYECALLSFEVERGTVAFSFDDDVLTAEVLKLLQPEKP